MEPLEDLDDKDNPVFVLIPAVLEKQVEEISVGGGGITYENSEFSEFDSEGSEPDSDGPENLSEPLEIDDITYGIDIKPKTVDPAIKDSIQESEQSNGNNEITLEFTSYEENSEENIENKDSEEFDEIEEEIEEFDIYYDHVSNAYDIPIYIDIAPNIETDESDYTEKIEQIDEEQISDSLVESPDSSGQISFLEQPLLSDQDSSDEIQQDEQQEISFDVVFDPYLEGIIYLDELLDILNLVDESELEHTELEEYIEFREPVTELETELEPVSETEMDLDITQDAVEENIFVASIEGISEISEIDELLATEIEVQEQQLDELAISVDSTEITEESHVEVEQLKSEALIVETEVSEIQDVEESEAEIIYESKENERINRIYSDGTLEREESTERIITKLPINIALWVEMNKRNRIKVKTDFEFINEHQEIEKIENVEIEIYRTDSGVIIILPFNEKGNKVRGLIREKGLLKSTFFGLLGEIEHRNRSDSFEERLQILVELIQPRLRETEKIEVKLKGKEKTKVTFQRKGNQIHIRKKTHDKLLYKNIKEGRGSTGYYIYQSGKILLKKIKGSNIRVPLELQKWKIIPSFEGESIELVVNIYTSIGQKSNLFFDDIKVLVYKTKHGLFLRILDEEKVRVFNQIEEGIVFFIDIPSKHIGVEQLKSTKKLKQAQKFLNKTDFGGIKQSKIIALWLLKGEIKFKLLMNHNGSLFLMQKGNLSNEGLFRISTALRRYIKDFDKNEFLYVSLNGENPIFLEAEVRYNDKGSVEKYIRFPEHNKNISNADILITSPNWKLQERFKDDLKLNKLLQGIGFNSHFLTSDTVKRSVHKNKGIENLFKRILEKIYSKLLDYNVLTEVELLSPNKQKDVFNYERMLLDVMIVPKKLDVEKIIVIEIKTSTSQYRNSELRKGIFEVKHQLRRLGKDLIIPIVVIGFDRKKDRRITTKIYGLANGVLIIGLADLTKLNNEPEYLYKLITEFQRKNSLLESNPTLVLHPISGELVSQEELYKESYDYLVKTQNEGFQNSSSFKKYSLLMNIPLVILKRIINNFKKNELNSDLINYRRKEELDIEFFHEFLRNNKTAILQFSLVHNDPDFDTISTNKEILQKFIPLRLRFIRKIYSTNEFEEIIINELKKQGLDVISNIVCSNGFYEFEVDQLIIRKTGIIPVSCKDHSGYSNLGDLIDKIKNNANEIEHITEQFNAKKGLLYIKVPDNYKEDIKKEFENKVYENVTIIIK